MKKSLLIASMLLVTAFAVSCNKEPKVEDAVTLNSAATATVPVEGDVVSISFNATVPWTAKSSESWLTVSPASGEAGDMVIKASALKNEQTDDRSATVTITAGTASADVTITQSQLNALNLDTTEFEVPAEGGTVEIPVSANVDYTIVIPEAVDWITVTETKGMVSSKAVLTVAETHMYVQDSETWEIYEDAIARSAKVTVKAGNLEQTVTVNQKAFYPYFDYDGDWSGMQWSFYDGAPVIFPQEGGTFTIDVVTNIPWRAYMSVWSDELNDGVDIMDNGWAKISFDEEHIYLTLEPNDSYFTRQDYLYSVGIIDGVEDGNFGGLGWFRQEGLPFEGAAYEYAWSKTLNELNIPAGYNRLAYTATGALLVSDGEKVHAISPADGTYWKSITYPGITPTSICSDDAGNVIVAPDMTADIDWATGTLTSGTEYTIYYSANPNEMSNSFTVANTLYGSVGGIRVRGDLSKKAVISGVAGSSSSWFAYEVDNYVVKSSDAYGGPQNRGAGAGIFWNCQNGASIALGSTLSDGLLYRAYDGERNVYYLDKPNVPNWVEAQTMKEVASSGNGSNENQNNLAVAEYNGKRVAVYTQGFHFNYSSDASIYVLDVTNVNDIKPLATINPTEDIELTEDFTGAASADVLLHPAEDCLEVFVVNSGRSIICKYKVLF